MRAGGTGIRAAHSKLVFKCTHKPPHPKPCPQTPTQPYALCVFPSCLKSNNQFCLTTIARWSHPFSISNRKVKRLSADDSGLRACESRSSSGTIYQTPYRQLYGVFLWPVQSQPKIYTAPLIQGFLVSI